MTEPTQPSRRTATGDEAGIACPHCRFPLSEGVSVAECPTCDAVHHEDCWSAHGGCAVAGCASGPAAATRLSSGADATAAGATEVEAPGPDPTILDAVGAAAPPPPPPPAPPPAPAPAPEPAPAQPTTPLPTQPAGSSGGQPPRPGMKTSTLAIIVTVSCLVLGGAAGAIVEVVSDSGSSPTTQASVPVTNGTTVTNPLVTETSGTTTRPPATTPRTTPTPAKHHTPTRDASLDRANIVDLLDRYGEAYSDQSVGELSVLMTPGVTRIGEGPAGGGCHTSNGRAAVLAVYAGQFGQLSRGATYTLTNLRESLVNLHGRFATVPVRYAISGPASTSTGSVTFNTRVFDGDWRISRIKATC